LPFLPADSEEPYWLADSIREGLLRGAQHKKQDINKRTGKNINKKHKQINIQPIKGSKKHTTKAKHKQRNEETKKYANT